MGRRLRSALFYPLSFICIPASLTVYRQEEPGICDGCATPTHLSHSAESQASMRTSTRTVRDATGTNHADKLAVFIPYSSVLWIFPANLPMTRIRVLRNRSVVPSSGIWAVKEEIVLPGRGGRARSLPSYGFPKPAVCEGIFLERIFTSRQGGCRRVQVTRFAMLCFDRRDLSGAGRRLHVVSKCRATAIRPDTASAERDFFAIWRRVRRDVAILPEISACRRSRRGKLFRAGAKCRSYLPRYPGQA